VRIANGSRAVCELDYTASQRFAARGFDFFGAPGTPLPFSSPSQSEGDGAPGGARGFARAMCPNLTDQPHMNPTHLDLLHLFDFGIDQTTVVAL
jgi:hypothetical protein